MLSPLIELAKLSVVMLAVEALKCERAEVGRDFTTWIKGRIEDYDFLADRDFIVYANSGENPLEDRTSHDYYCTISMAKELSMLENNPTGRRVRKEYSNDEIAEQPF